MKTIHRYVLGGVRSIFGRARVVMPKRAKILHVGIKDQTVSVWAEIDTEEKKHNEDFYIAWTGRVAPENANYITTLIHRTDLVLHIYKIPYDSYADIIEEDDFG